MKISVICPVYNAKPHFLEAAVASVASQEGGDDCEILLVDDGSNSQETLESLKNLEALYPQVKRISSGGNAGPASARNLGIRSARHEWIGFIDSDDLWPPEKITAAKDVIRRLPDTRWVGGNYANLFEGDRMVENSYAMSNCKPEKTVSGIKRFSTPDLTRTLISGWLHIGTSFIKADLVREIGGFDARAVFGEDWLLFVDLSLKAPMDFTEQSSYILRRQDSSMMRSSRRMSWRYLTAMKILRRRKDLKKFSREMRWQYYALHKDVAMNCLLNRRRIAALWYASKALSVSPDEIKEYKLFLGAALFSSPSSLPGMMKKYSSAEQVILS